MNTAYVSYEKEKYRERLKCLHRSIIVEIIDLSARIREEKEQKILRRKAVRK